MRDKATGRSRGFGFLTYEDMDSLDKSLELPRHELDGRTVEVKRAIPRGEVKTIRRKLFVGGVSPTTTSESLREAFIKFGPIAEAQIMKDRMRGRSRGFGFVTFEDDESILQALGTSEHRVDGKLVDVKRAEPKKRSSGGALSNPMANFSSPNSSPRSPLAFTSPMLGGYPMNFTLLPYTVMNPEYSTSGTNLGNYNATGYSEAPPTTYLFASPYASPRGSFAIGETDLPTDFAELSMGRRFSHDFANYSAGSSLDQSAGGGYGSASQMSGPIQPPGSMASGSNTSAGGASGPSGSAPNGVPSLSLPNNNTSGLGFQQLQHQQQLASPRGPEPNSPNANTTSSFGSLNSFYMPQYQLQQFQQLQQMQLYMQQQQQQQQQQHHQQQFRLSPSQQRSNNVMRQDSLANGAAAPQTPSPDSNSPAVSSPTPITTLNKEQEKEEAVERSQTPVTAERKYSGGRSSTPIPRTSTPVISAPKDHTGIITPIATRALDGKMGVENDNTDHPRTSSHHASPVTVPLPASRSTPQFA